jgi:hypothetical protein
VVAVCAEVDLLASDSEEARFKTLFFQHHQGVFQNVLGGLLSRASTDANYHGNSSKIHKRQYALKLSHSWKKMKKIREEKKPWFW